MASLAEGEIHRTEATATVDDVTWYYVLHWGELRGRAEVVGLELWSVPPTNPERLDFGAIQERQLPPGGAPITSSVVRGLNVGSLINQQRAAAIKMLRSVAASEAFSERAREASARDLERMRRPGPQRKYDDRHYAEVARVYLAAFQENRSPTRAVAQHFGVSQSMAAKFVWKARSKEYGLLAPTSSGLPSGAPASSSRTKRQKGEQDK
jgi:hypothetical protein